MGCVIHAHPKEALICGITELEFRPIFGAFNIQAMRMALEGIPVFPRSYLVNRPELAAPMIEIMGEKRICLMKGHGITVTGKTVEEATVRALNFNTLGQSDFASSSNRPQSAGHLARRYRETPRSRIHLQ